MDPITQKPYSGLSSEAAAKLLAQHGRNEIEQSKTRSPWQLLFEQFKSPLVVILIFACALSAALGEVVEAAAIGAILALNALIGFFQEYRAETAILALQDITAPRAKVIRDGRQLIIPAHDVVPGEILLLEAGDIVAADSEIVESSHLQVNEAILTGESRPARKSQPNSTDTQPPNERDRLVFMGTAVVTGTALVKATATGMRTELGRIAKLISTVESEPTPLQVQLAKVGRSLLLICLAVVAVVAVIGVAQGRSWLDILVFSVSLAVAAVPEGMPAIVTVALALGVQRLAARNALIRKLPSVETLGSVSVICTDKTGTLTTGHMRVRDIWGEDYTEIVRAAASCSDAELDLQGNSGTGDPTEIAILIAALERGIRKETIESANPRTSSEPFDAERRRMSVLRQDSVNYVKGASETIFSLSNLSSPNIQAATKAATDMSARGLRVLAVAIGHGPGEKNLHFLGLLGIADPPRTEAADSIREARRAGIIPVMITGDHPHTAAAIARELGLLLEGEAVDSRVHARATPEDKLKLVRKWKSEGHIVAMTGDGVNDAPALREAHIGIAMGRSGTEVTRQASDLILADDNFATIVAAVREGRGIFENIRRSISYLLTGNLAEIIVVLGAITLSLPLPLLASHLLWINLVTDALPALTLIVEKLSPNIMTRPPRSKNEPLLGRPEWSQIIAVGLLEATVSLGLYWYLLKEHDVDYARSILFSEIVFSQLVRSFGARSSTRTFWETGLFSNLWMLAIVLVTGLTQVSLHYIPVAQKIFALQPLHLADFLLIGPCALVTVSVIEIRKLLLRAFKS